MDGAQRYRSPEGKAQVMGFAGAHWRRDQLKSYIMENRRKGDTLCNRSDDYLVKTLLGH
jgi:hypothetical protein